MDGFYIWTPYSTCLIITSSTGTPAYRFAFCRSRKTQVSVQHYGYGCGYSLGYTVVNAVIRSLPSQELSCDYLYALRASRISLLILEG